MGIFRRCDDIKNKSYVNVFVCRKDENLRLIVNVFFGLLFTSFRCRQQVMLYFSFILLNAFKTKCMKKYGRHSNKIEFIKVCTDRIKKYLYFSWRQVTFYRVVVLMYIIHSWTSRCVRVSYLLFINFDSCQKHLHFSFHSLISTNILCITLHLYTNISRFVCKILLKNLV